MQPSHGPNFADWLAPDENTNKDLLASLRTKKCLQTDFRICPPCARKSHRYRQPLYPKPVVLTGIGASFPVSHKSCSLTAP